MALNLKNRRQLLQKNARTKAVDIATVIDARPKLMPREGRNPCDAAAKERLITGLIAGRTQWDMLATDPTLPSESSIYLARKADPQFDAEYQAARSAGLVARIEEAVDYSGSVRSDKQLAIGAEKYMNAVTKAAEKLSPKTMGALVRHADADGEKLSITVMDYRQQQIPIVDAQFTELPKPANAQQITTNEPTNGK